MHKIIMSLGLLAATAVFATFGGVNTAEAKAKKCFINCNQPTAVKKGQKIPVWRVKYCVVGSPGSYREVDCKSREAVHRTPIGTKGVCFIGSDGKEHWDYQREVHVGRPFINRFTGGRWQPDWQDARPY